MKKSIKLVLILILSIIPIYLYVDSIILKSLIIKQIEKATKKKAYIKKLNISYFPKSKIELYKVKIPNPSEDNFIITFDSLKIKFNLLKLFEKSIIIDELIANNATIFDKSRKTTPLIITKENSYTSSNNNEKNAFKVKFKELISKISLGESVGTSNINISFKEELNQIDTIINGSNEVIKNKKEIVLTNTNTILHDISSLKVDNIDSINHYNELTKSLKKINKNTKKLKKEITSLDDIYIQSINKIDEVETTIIKKANESIKLPELSKDNNKITSNFSEPVTLIVKNILKKLKRERRTSEKKHYTGVTYNFNSKNYPKFLITKLQINKPDNNLYVNGEYLTFSKKIKEPFVFKSIIKNQEKFRRQTIDINSTDKETFYINQSLKNLVLNKGKIFEDNNIKVDLLENNTTYIDISGIIREESDIKINIQIEKPLYRVINKNSETNNIKQALFELLNEQDIIATINILGDLKDVEIKTETNLDFLLNDIRSQVLSNKLKSFNDEQKTKLAKIKKENSNIINKKLNLFEKNYNESLAKMNFQLNEIVNQTNEAEKKINDSKRSLEDSAKEKFSEEAENLFKN